MERSRVIQKESDSDWVSAVGKSTTKLVWTSQSL